MEKGKKEEENPLFCGNRKDKSGLSLQKDLVNVGQASVSSPAKWAHNPLPCRILCGFQEMLSEYKFPPYFSSLHPSRLLAACPGQAARQRASKEQIALSSAGPLAAAAGAWCPEPSPCLPSGWGGGLLAFTTLRLLTAGATESQLSCREPRRIS